jgi:hypothetical protein
MRDEGVKTQLDRICHLLTTRFGPLPSLYVPNDEGHPWLHRPASLAVVEDAERLLGFALPPLMRAIYTRLANGGGTLNMGGLFPHLRDHSDPYVRMFDIVAGHADCVAEHPRSYQEVWPEKRVPFFYHGCSVVSCIDCSTPEGTVWEFNEGSWSILNPTLVEYVEDHLASAWPF